MNTSRVVHRSEGDLESDGIIAYRPGRMVELKKRRKLRCQSPTDSRREETARVEYKERRKFGPKYEHDPGTPV